MVERVVSVGLYAQTSPWSLPRGSHGSVSSKISADPTRITRRRHRSSRSLEGDEQPRRSSGSLSQMKAIYSTLSDDLAQALAVAIGGARRSESGVDRARRVDLLSRNRVSGGQSELQEISGSHVCTQTRGGCAVCVCLSRMAAARGLASSAPVPQPRLPSVTQPSLRTLERTFLLPPTPSDAEADPSKTGCSPTACRTGFKRLSLLRSGAATRSLSPIRWIDSINRSTRID